MRPRNPPRFTVFFTKEQLDTPIARLHEFGLDMRVVNAMERNFGAVFINDLVGMTEQEICGLGRNQLRLRRRSVNQLRESLLRFLEMCVE